MDRYTDQVEVSQAAHPLSDWPESPGQGDLFGNRAGVTEPLGNVIQVGALAPPAVEPSIGPAALDNRGFGQSGRLDLIHGASLPHMEPDQRDHFVENCLRAQDNERLKLGRELHDSTGQLLLALRLEIAHLRQVQGTSAEGSLLDEIDETAREIDREIRAFAFTHYPAEIGRDGLGPALRSLARGFASRTGLQIRFNSPPDPVTRTGQIAFALLRVAQEALLNVHRHARAVHVNMALTLHDEMLELTVRDDGVGLPLAHDLEESHGVGLQGMRHRVERLGGHFAIRRLKHGTKIIAAVPA